IPLALLLIWLWLIPVARAAIAMLGNVLIFFPFKSYWVTGLLFVNLEFSMALCLAFSSTTSGFLLFNSDILFCFCDIDASVKLDGFMFNPLWSLVRITIVLSFKSIGFMKQNTKKRKAAKGIPPGVSLVLFIPARFPTLYYHISSGEE
ncbi:MAG TPA: hypothetical protein PLS00_18725, partial [Niabella sp.]|nr:hypothetical protein [Niabella sp.]